MVVSERTLKWAMRLYPPLLLQRIWVKDIGKDFKHVEVRISKSFININYNKSIFGGTIFSAADPFYAVCFYQILKRKGLNVVIWVKSAKIEFLKPAYTTLSFSVSITPADLEAIYVELDDAGRFTKLFRLEMRDTRGEICAIVDNEVYIRKL